MSKPIINKPYGILSNNPLSLSNQFLTGETTKRQISP